MLSFFNMQGILKSVHHLNIKGSLITDISAHESIALFPQTSTEF